MKKHEFQVDRFQMPELKRTFADADVLPSLRALQMDKRPYRHLGKKGDLVVALIEVHLAGDKRPQPAMLIANHRNPTQQHVVVPLHSLWRYFEPDNLVSIAPQMAERLFGVVTKDDCVRVLDCIYDFGNDLITAPAAETRITFADWVAALAQDDVKFTHSTGRPH